ncbi:MAG: hypothetical protein NW218_13330 [Saprospiraceae bacterium]|jgi:hypothetical protein|nr:hypothetical protein [Saprospiraceae bacterium]
MKKKPKTEKKPKAAVNPVEDIEIKVNALGQIEKNFEVEQIIQFLNENVPDKKLSGEE